MQIWGIFKYSLHEGFTVQNYVQTKPLKIVALRLINLNLSKDNCFTIIINFTI
jgi:hypothetical protein